MKRRSVITAEIYKEWGPTRRAFVAEGDCCICGASATDCHEIVGGAVRMKAFVERAAWLRVCRTCHDILQGESKAKQLALKLITDPAYFNREKVCEVWGRPSSAVTADEVLESLRHFLASGIRD